MYKVLYNNEIIDVIVTPKYRRFLENSNKAVSTDRCSAHGIIGSNNEDVYAFIGYGRNKWPEVTLCEISDEEFASAQKALSTSKFRGSDLIQIIEARQRKLSELNLECQKLITNGINVTLSNKETKHFRLSIEDQINLLNIEKLIENGHTNILYHATNELCEIYSNTDLRKIIKCANAHIQENTLKYNLLKYCIRNMYNIEDINNVCYNTDVLSLNLKYTVKKKLKEVINGR